MTRTYDSNDAYVYIKFSSSTTIKLGSEIQNAYQATDYFRMLYMDMHPDSGTSTAVTSSVLNYEISMLSGDEYIFRNITGERSGESYGVR